MTALSPHPENRRFWPGGICLLLALATLSVYLPVRHHGFIALDDGDYVKDNRMVQAGLTWAGIKWAFTTGHSGNWHPVTWLSHMCDAQFFGGGPKAPHLTNLLLHATNALLLFGLLRRLTGALARSALVAAFFALHPLHVESVAWISERKDVLSAFFFLLTLAAYANYTAAEKTQSRTVIQWYSMALSSFAFGLMSKPMLVTLPCVMLLLDLWPLQRLSLASRRESVVRVVREKLPFFTLSAASCIVTLVMQKRGGAVGSLTSYGIDARVENALVSYARYLGNLFWPTDLAVIYPHPGNLPAVQVVLSALLIGGVSFAAIWWLRNSPFVAVGWFWFLGMLVPTIGLVQVGVQSMADRYTYLPSIGAFIAVVWGAGKLLGRWEHTKTTAVLATGIAIACGLATRTQLAHWQSNESLFRHTLMVTAENFAAHNSLGHSYLEEGRVNEAIVEFERTLEIQPDFAEAHNNLGTALLRQGRIEPALTCFRKAVHTRPGFALARYNAGTVLLQTGRIDEAIVELEKAATLRSDDALIRLNLGNAHLQKGQIDAAIAQYRSAIVFAPDNADLQNNLGQSLLQKGRIDEAFVHFQAAVKIDPEHANAHFLLGERSLRLAQWDEAIVHFQQTLKSQPDDADAHLQLAIALRERGRLTEAAVHQEKGTRLRGARP
jgi:tetratricopeptide (TPR) repeat protein